MSTEHPARQAGQDVMSEAEIEDAFQSVRANLRFGCKERPFRMLQKLAATARKAGELQAVVDKLPKTAEGITVLPGAMVWTTGGAEWIVICDEGGYRAAEPNAIEHDPSCPVSECYSTREAAIKNGGLKWRCLEH